MCLWLWGLRRAKEFACPGLPSESQPAPAPSCSQDSSPRVTGSLPLPKFFLSSVGADGGGDERSSSAGAAWPGSGAGQGEQKPDKWDAGLEDLPQAGSGSQDGTLLGKGD